MWHVWRKGEMCIRCWWGKPEGKRPLGRPRRRWEDNIKMDLEEVGRGLWGLDGVVLRIGTDGGALVSTVMNCGGCFIKCGEFFD
jgi:hypothetical protein